MLARFCVIFRGEGLLVLQIDSFKLTSSQSVMGLGSVHCQACCSSACNLHTVVWVLNCTGSDWKYTRALSFEKFASIYDRRVEKEWHFHSWINSILSWRWFLGSTCLREVGCSRPCCKCIALLLHWTLWVKHWVLCYNIGRMGTSWAWVTTEFN